MISMRALGQRLLPGGIVAGVLATSLLALPLVSSNVAISLVGCSYGYLNAPTITGISPTSGTIFGGTVVTITGCGFTGVTAVHFGANGATFTINNDSTIHATSPAHAAGMVDVDVTRPQGTSAHTTADKFTYGAAPCTGVTAIVENSATITTAPAGSNNLIFATAVGCTQPLFAFWILNPGGSWILAQPYAARNTMNWDTGGPEAAGTYYYSVWVRDASSTGTTCDSLGCKDAFKPGTAFPLTTMPCTSVTATNSVPSPQNQGTTVTITGHAVGCNSPQYQFWLLAPGSTTWQIAQPYSGNASFTWLTGGTNGTYHVSVWARDHSSAGISCSSLGCNDAFAPGSVYQLN